MINLDVNEILNSVDFERGLNSLESWKLTVEQAEIKAQWQGKRSEITNQVSVETSDLEPYAKRISVQVSVFGTQMRKPVDSPYSDQTTIQHRLFSLGKYAAGLKLLFVDLPIVAEKVGHSNMWSYVMADCFKDKDIRSGSRYNFAYFDFPQAAYEAVKRIIDKAIEQNQNDMDQKWIREIERKLSLMSPPRVRRSRGWF